MIVHTFEDCANVFKMLLEGGVIYEAIIDNLEDVFQAGRMLCPCSNLIRRWQRQDLEGCSNSGIFCGT